MNQSIHLNPVSITPNMPMIKVPVSTATVQEYACHFSHCVTLYPVHEFAKGVLSYLHTRCTVNFHHCKALGIIAGGSGVLSKSLYSIPLALHVDAAAALCGQFGGRVPVSRQSAEPKSR